MKKKALAIALSLAGIGDVHAAAPRALPMEHLEAAIRSPNGTWTAPPPASQAPGPTLAWVHRQDLEELATRNAVVDAIGGGRAVLVTGIDAARDTEHETFGYRSGGAIAAYWLSPSGVLETMSVDDALSTAETHAALVRWLASRVPSHGEPQPVSAALTAPSAEAEYVPSLRIRDDRSFAGGRGIRTDIEVTRDVSDSHDDKVIVVRTEVDQAPSFTGVFMPQVGYSPVGHGEQLWVPDRYVVTNQLTGVEEPVPIRIAEVVPQSDGRTDRSVADKLTVKASTGASLTAELADIANNPAMPFKGKLAVSYNSSKETTREYSVAMTLKDYSIESGTRSHEGTRAVDWVFPLASDIASHGDYFMKGPDTYGDRWNDTTKVTPMMRRAALQTVAVWRVPGSYEGHLDLATSSSVVRREYHQRLHTIGTSDDPEADIRTQQRIDLGAPTLTRQPTVRLQSLSSTGLCLSQPEPNAYGVTMETCDRAEGARRQQWYLEADGTYRNRGSHRCLTAQHHDGSVLVDHCADATLNQQWRWSADRILSRFEAGDSMWRLFVVGDVPYAKPDGFLARIAISNPYHPLLLPWSSYPRKPSEGDVIPGLAGKSPPIPASYLDMSRIGTEERWHVQAVRAGE